LQKFQKSKYKKQTGQRAINQTGVDFSSWQFRHRLNFTFWLFWLFQVWFLGFKPFIFHQFHSSAEIKPKPEEIEI